MNTYGSSGIFITNPEPLRNRIEVYNVLNKNLFWPKKIILNMYSRKQSFLKPKLKYLPYGINLEPFQNLKKKFVGFPHIHPENIILSITIKMYRGIYSHFWLNSERANFKAFFAWFFSSKIQFLNYLKRQDRKMFARTVGTDIYKNV